MDCNLTLCNLGYVCYNFYIGFSLVWSSSVNMGTDRKQKVADFIDQAIAVSTRRIL